MFPIELYIFQKKNYFAKNMKFSTNPDLIFLVGKKGTKYSQFIGCGENTALDNKPWVS